MKIKYITLLVKSKLFKMYMFLYLNSFPLKGFKKMLKKMCWITVKKL